VRSLLHGMAKCTGDEKLRFALDSTHCSTAPHEFVTKLPIDLDCSGRIVTDQCLRVPTLDGVFAIGDCAVTKVRVGSNGIHKR
jgi:thioredoxin reductase